MSDVVIKTIIAEAGGDPQAQAAVAWVIANRAAKEGKTPEQIVKARGQFEGYSNPGPGSRKAQHDPGVVAKAKQVWSDVRTGAIADPTNGGTMYHADYISPSWAKSADKNGKINIGGNVFYKGSSPGTALEAINSVAPPVPRARPDTALAYAPPAPLSPAVRVASVFPNGQTVDQAPALPRQRPVQPQDVGSLPPPPMAELDRLLATGRANTGTSAHAGSDLLPNGFNSAIYGGQYVTGGPLSPSVRNGVSGTGPALSEAPSPSLISRSAHTVPIDGNGNPVQPPSAVRSGVAATGFGTNVPVGAPTPRSIALEPSQFQRNNQAAIANLPIIGPAAKGLGDVFGALTQPSQPAPSPPAIAPSVRNGQTAVGSALSITPSPIRAATNMTGNNASPYIPGPTQPIKVADRLAPSSPLDIGSPVQSYTTKTVMVPKQVAIPYINSTPPSSAILGGLNMTGGVLPKAPAPTYKTVMVPTTVRVPTVPVPVAPKPTFMQQAGTGLQTLFNGSPIGHITQLLTGKPVTGGLLSLFQGDPVHAAALTTGGVLGGNNNGSATTFASNLNPGVSRYLSESGQSAGVNPTAGEQANALRKSLSGSQRGSFS